MSARRLHAAALAFLGAGLALNSALGPALSEAFEFHVSETIRNQQIGLDLVSLVVVAPLALLASALVLRRHAAGPLLALGIGSYVAYMVVQYALGPEYVARPGDSQALFPLYLVLFVLGWGVALAGWVAAEPRCLPAVPAAVPKVVLPVLGTLAFARYVPALADAMSATPEDGGYLAGPTFFWTIALLDLGVFVPATVAACVGLVRRARWAAKALYLVIGWFGLVGPAVAGMALAMWANGDPNASGGGAVFMVALGLAFALVAVRIYRPLFRGS